MFKQISFLFLLFSFASFAQELRLGIPAGHSESITEIKLNHDESKLYSVSDDHSIKVWDRSTQKLLVDLKHPGKLQDWAISPTGEFIIGKYDSLLIGWHVQSETPFFKVESRKYSFANFDPSESKVAFYPNDSTLGILSLTAPYSLKEIPLDIKTTSEPPVFLKDPDLVYISNIYSGVCINTEKDSVVYTIPGRPIALFNDSISIHESDFALSLFNLKRGEIITSHAKDRYSQHILGNIGPNGKCVLADGNKFKLYPLTITPTSISRGNSFYSSIYNNWAKDAFVSYSGQLAYITINSDDILVFETNNWKKIHELKGAQLASRSSNLEVELQQDKKDIVFLLYNKEFQLCDHSDQQFESNSILDKTPLDRVGEIETLVTKDRVLIGAGYYGLTAPLKDFSNYIEEVELSTYSNKPTPKHRIYRSHTNSGLGNFDLIGTSITYKAFYKDSSLHDTPYREFKLDLTSGHVSQGWQTGDRINEPPKLFIEYSGGFIGRAYSFSVGTSDSAKVKSQKKYRNLFWNYELDFGDLYRSDNGNLLAVNHRYWKTELYDISEEIVYKKSWSTVFPQSVQFSNSDHYLNIFSGRKVKQVDVKTLKKTNHFKLKHRIGKYDGVLFSSQGNFLAHKKDYSLEVYNVNTGQQVFEESFSKRFWNYGKFAHPKFSPEEKYIVYNTKWNRLIIIDLLKGKTILDLKDVHYGYGVQNVCFIQGDREILVPMADASIQQWNVESGELIATYIGHSGDIKHITAFKDGFISYSEDGSFAYWEMDTYEPVLRHFILDDDPRKWVHIHSSGLFDASEEAKEIMYWVKGDEIIEFEQLEKRFWLPGLWKQVQQGRPLPKLGRLNDVELGPKITLGTLSNDTLPISIVDRGGGIGELHVFLNGKEINSNTLNASIDRTLQSQKVYLDLKDHPYFTDTNEVRVTAESANGLLETRGELMSIIKEDREQRAPDFHAIIIGVQDYANASINLKFPKKDAEAIQKSIEIGANRLFGAARTNVHSLTSGGDQHPNKMNIKKLFTDVAAQAKADDILFIYLSGHGITWGNEESDFYFLTADAISAKKDAYGDEAIRNTMTISSTEIIQWIQEIPALKQVMIIDACGSGQAVSNLMASRDVEPAQIKAIDRMRDRTGMFIISGCAADAVSYESSKYGQGLLTFAVLQALKGAALKEDKYVDVAQVLSHARETVPLIAQGLGGVQEPQYLTPKGGSFDIGILEKEDRDLIPLNDPKTAFKRSMLLNRDKLEDDLNLSAQLNAELALINTRGGDQDIVYYDTDAYGDACRVSGLYWMDSGIIHSEIRISCQEDAIIVEIEASNNSELIEKVLQKIEELVQ